MMMKEHHHVDVMRKRKRKNQVVEDSIHVVGSMLFLEWVLVMWLVMLMKRERS